MLPHNGGMQSAPQLPASKVFVRAQYSSTEMQCLLILIAIVKLHISNNCSSSHMYTLVSPKRETEQISEKNQIA